MQTSKTSLIAIIAILSGTSLLAQQQGAVANQCATTATKLCDISELDKRPEPIKRVQPAYPAALKSSHTTGEAVVSFVVDVDGSVKNLCVEKATDPAFGDAAIAAVSAWKFEPGYKNGAPVACKLSLPLHFALEKR